MARRKNNVDLSHTVDHPLAEDEIVEFFEKLNLGSAAERESYFWLDRLNKQIDLEQEQPSDGLRVIFGNSSIDDPTPR
jgi:hypothetical protein